MQDVKKIIIKNVKEDSKIVIACSGGPDSMAILSIFNNLKKELNLTLICAHVNHNMRIESDNEAKKVEKFCKINNIEFEYFKIMEYKKENFHHQARKIRYDFFEKVIAKYNASYLVTAHHGDDLIETILMRIGRGSTLKGYKGFDLISKKDNYDIFRPFIYKTKSEIENYAISNNIPYDIDNSNNEDHYKRNRIRHNVLPILKEEYVDVHLKFKEFSDELNMYNMFFEKELNKIIDKIIIDNAIVVDIFNRQEKLIQIKIIEKFLSNIYDGKLEVITKKHVNLILDILNENKNKNVSLPFGFIGILEYNYFKILKNNIDENFHYILEDVVKNQYFEIKVLQESDLKSNYILRLNSNEIKLPIIIRNKKIGDIIDVKNLNGSKKVSDIFVNQKISKSDRNKIPVITDSNNKILWIAGVKKSKFDKEKNENYDIILEYTKFKEEENEKE